MTSQPNERPGFHLRIFGIRVRIHRTFLVLLAWVLAGTTASGRSTLAGFVAVALILTLFTCVVLHELGHALVARHSGVRTSEITLYPIGRVARFDRIPERPREGLMIAAAGPLVNFVIAAVLLAFPVQLVTRVPDGRRRMLREPLEDALLRLQASTHTTLPIVRSGELVGMLTLEHMMNWLALRRAIDGPSRVRAGGFSTATRSLT